MSAQSKEAIPVSITDEAARWVSESFDGALSPEHQAQLDAWLAADPRHARAFAEMQGLWGEMDSVPETKELRASVPPALRSRRSKRDRTLKKPRGRSRWVAPAIAASLALVFVGVSEDWPLRLRADAMTATGERRSVALPDGSTVMLDTHSALSIDYDAGKRVVRLLKGEAAFTVAADPERPFTVEAAGGSTTALGTKFLVRSESENTQVIVTEHRVRVAYPAPDGAAVLVGEGEGVSYGPGSGLSDASSVKADDAMAWTQGVRVFKDAPLSQVVAEIGRYHRGYIRVAPDAQLLRVSGVFRIDDPVAALDQLQRSLGLRSLRLTERLIFIST